MNQPQRSQGLARTVLAMALGLLATTCAGDGGVGAVAQGDNVSTCPPVAELDAPRLLRQLSLDLRGTPPTYQELEAAARDGRVSEATVNAMLQSPAFLEQTRRWHASILWPNLDGFTLQAAPLRLTSGGTNPEVAVDVLDLRTSEATCPSTGTANLTAASCCTTTNPNHPSCCLVRNRTFNASDEACLAKARAVGAIYIAYNGLGDVPLRGRGGGGCDQALEYPPPRVAATDRRWPHDSQGRPYYTSPRSGLQRFYYDRDDVPLPYDDWTHCPNYCRAITPTGAGGAYAAADYVSKRYTQGGTTRQGDSPAATCPAGYTEVENPCDNTLDRGTDQNLRIRREGYRLVTPYWSEGHPVKVCAYDAQDREASVYTGRTCAPLRSGMDPSCGCGPEGRYCMPSQGYRSRLPSRTERYVREGLNREPLEIVASVIARDEDYFHAYTTRRSFVNGPLAYLYKHQVNQVVGFTLAPPVPSEQLPELPYGDTAWREYVRGPEHFGVLTTAAFLGRFPTWRARINRFRTALLCRPFVPPEGALPSPDHPCNREQNLAQRCGCQHCHAAMEPLGSYWGRWAERSAVYLDPVTFPVFDPNCQTCALTGAGCTTRCRNNYVTNPLTADDSRYAGMLFGYLYRTPEELHRPDDGPSALVANALSTGEMQACTVRTTWERLVRRPMNEGEQDAVLPALLQQFEASHHNYRALVRAIVTSPAYRRID